MTVTVRAVGPDELEAFRATMGSAFGFDPTPELLSRFETILERARSRCAFDGNQMVGTSGAFSLEMTVPGGTVACSGTSLVSVRPSHRRRGVLRAMMAAHLVEARDHGDALAALWASESSIYGRFGFGVAAVELDLTIPRGFVDLHRLAPPPIRYAWYPPRTPAICYRRSTTR